MKFWPMESSTIFYWKCMSWQMMHFFLTPLSKFSLSKYWSCEAKMLSQWPQTWQVSVLVSRDYFSVLTEVLVALRRVVFILNFWVENVSWSSNVKFQEKSDGSLKKWLRWRYDDIKTTFDAVFEGFQLWRCTKTAGTKNIRVDIFVNSNSPKKTQTMLRFDHPWLFSTLTREWL